MGKTLYNIMCIACGRLDLCLIIKMDVKKTLDNLRN